MRMLKGGRALDVPRWLLGDRLYGQLEAAARGDDRHLVPNHVPDQRPANRGLIRDPSRLRVGFSRSNNRVDLFLAIRVGYRDMGADPDVAGRGGVLHDDGVGEEPLQSLDPALDEGLLVLGIVILSIVHSVRELLRLADTIGDFVPANSSEMMKLLVEFGETFPRKVNALLHS